MATGDLRTETEHDADRLLYSSAFRRLAGVTQVVAADEIQLFHNRLTHTLKVAQLAKRLAQDLSRDPDNKEYLRAEGGPRIDVDAAEAAALAHDIGHPPFGHIAEDVLREKCDSYHADGFEGNAQSFRIVTKLATRGSRPGLGLSSVTLRGILKYPWLRGPAGSTLPPGASEKDRTEAEYKHRKWGAYLSEKRLLDALLAGDLSEEKSPEASIMDFADDISYAIHDVEDFYRIAMIPLDRIGNSEIREAAEWFIMVASQELSKNPRFDPDKAHVALNKLKPLFPPAPYEGTDEDRRALHVMTNRFITAYFGAVSLHGTRPYIRIAKLEEHQIMLLKQLTWQYVVNSPNLATLQRGQMELVRGLFDSLMDWLSHEEKGKTLHRLPTRLRHLRENFYSDPDACDSLPEENARHARIVADYVCCLTEDQTYDLYRRLAGQQASSVLQGWMRW